MSGEQRGDNAVEPQSKRQKLSGDGKIIAFGGPMYDEATARKMLKEEVLVVPDEAEEIEFVQEAVIGFDPDDAALDDLYYVNNSHYWDEGEVTPLIYFGQKGDAKMCRYLISRGASTTKSSEEDGAFSPMFAAVENGHIGICKLLYANGAQDHVRKDDGFGWFPFHSAANTGQRLYETYPWATAVYEGHDKVVRWLIFHGALCADISSETVEGGLIYPETYHRSDIDKWTRITKERMSRSCERLVEWAKEVTQSHSALVMFLFGILPPAPDQDQSCILQCLSGQPGVRKHIGDFVGLEVTKRKHLRILRSVVDVLPSFIIN